MMRRFELCYLFFLVLLFSCRDNTPGDLKSVLKASGKNRSELQKVLDHYAEEGINEDKYKAACFLLANMGNKFWYDGEVVRGYNEIFKVIDSLKENNVHPLLRRSAIKDKFDSIKRYYGPPVPSSAEVYLDYENLSSDYLIENINLAFEAWHESKFRESISFSAFCNYILPYRVGTEVPELWRKRLKDKYKLLRDTNDQINSSMLKYAADINDDIEKQISYNNSKRIWIYPFDMTASNAERGYAICKHGVYYTVMAMRANGLPVGADYTACWANYSSGHHWNVLLQEDGSFFPFDAMTKPFKRLDIGDRRIAKVFRESFDIKAINSVPKHDDIPKSLNLIEGFDVTDEYTKTFDIRMALEPYKRRKEYAIICTFDNKSWRPQWWGKITDGNVSFSKMATNVIYIAMYYDKELIPASKPFLLTTDGTIEYISPREDQKIDLLLLRKYPSTKLNHGKMAKLKGGVFQGANDSLFTNPVNLLTIDSIPLKFETGTVNNLQTFRFVRFLSPENHFGQVAELEFYGEDGDKKETKLQGKIIGFPKLPPRESYERAFDGDLETYFIAEDAPVTWVGMDLGEGRKLTKIKYCPRSDVNFIVVGNEYELSYWNNEQWVSLGKKKANDAFLEYRNVPANAIYLLHCVTKGVEDRIFTYKDKKQVWW